jgi:hypothetical protein
MTNLGPIEAPVIPIAVDGTKEVVVTTKAVEVDEGQALSEEMLYPDRAILTSKSIDHLLPSCWVLYRLTGHGTDDEAYPGQVGIKPVPLVWGAGSAEERGPVLSSRHPDSIKKRNAVGSVHVLTDQ